MRVTKSDLSNELCNMSALIEQIKVAIIVTDKKELSKIEDEIDLLGESFESLRDLLELQKKDEEELCSCGSGKLANHELDDDFYCENCVNYDAWDNREKKGEF